MSCSWTPPLQDALKFNTDGVVIDNFSEAGVVQEISISPVCISGGRLFETSFEWGGGCGMMSLPFTLYFRVVTGNGKLSSELKKLEILDKRALLER
ncbi:hypothetical protein V6N11_036487 [Hibiscus sabdariffa]|uniref:Uncharacterized protein n=1 Tax=Hibiscus sabdariffa TaxID=183260 RepID=A0ABR2RBC2_9ROSI